MCLSVNFQQFILHIQGHAVDGSGTALQAGRSWFRFPTVSLEFFIDIILPSGRTMALESTQSLTEMSIRKISWGIKAAGAQV